jgi:DNA polymerase III alpha subunit
MAFFQLEDFSGSISCVAFSRSWTQEVKNLVKTGAQLYIYGKVDENKEQPSLFVGTVTPVKTCNFKSAIEIDLTVETATPGLISSLRELTSSGENLVIYRVRNETTGVVRGPYTIGSVPEIASVKDKILNLLPLTATIKYGTHCNAVLAA